MSRRLNLKIELQKNSNGPPLLILKVEKQSTANNAQRNKILRYSGLFLQITSTAMLMAAHFFIPAIPLLFLVFAALISGAGFVAAKAGAYLDGTKRVKKGNEETTKQIREFEEIIGIPKEQQFNPKHEENLSQKVSPYANALSYLTAVTTIILAVIGSPVSAIISLFGFFFTYVAGNLSDQDLRNDRRFLEEERQRLALKAVASGKVQLEAKSDWELLNQDKSESENQSTQIPEQTIPTRNSQTPIIRDDINDKKQTHTPSAPTQTNEQQTLQKTPFAANIQSIGSYPNIARTHHSTKQP
jgi:hypothetical protein